MPVLLVDEEDAEGAVVDQPLDLVRDALEQRVEVEDARELAADLGERLDRVRVAPLRFEQARVLDGDRHRRGEVAQRLDFGRRELAEVAAEQVERADRLALAPQRHHQLRPRARHDLDVVRLVGHVVGQQRAPGRDRRGRRAPRRAAAAWRSIRADTLRRTRCGCRRAARRPGRRPSRGSRSRGRSGRAASGRARRGRGPTPPRAPGRTASSAAAGRSWRRRAGRPPRASSRRSQSAGSRGNYTC